MTSTLEVDPQALRDFDRLPPPERGRLIRYLDERVLVLDDPRRLGGPLKGALKGLWRYRVGHMRVICRIEDRRLVILVVAVGNRRDIYR